MAGMTHNRRAPGTLPLMAAQLMLSSWEVIARRSLLMAQNRCSPFEYQRMVTEKMQAAQLSAVALMTSGMTSGGEASLAAVLAPWHRRAKANARRLRRS